jgi:proline iminopeptidase
MPKALRTFLTALVVMAAGPLLIFLLAFVLTWKAYPVMSTVSDDPKVPRIVIQQVALHAESFGAPQAPLLVVVHDGPGGDYRSLLPLKALADSLRVVFYDQRGSGLSARVPADQLSVTKSLAELEAVVAHYAGQKPVMLLGHGWGGMLAAAFAGRHPEQVSHLLLAEPGFLNTAMAAKILPELSRTSAGFIFNTALSWVRALHIQGPDETAAEDYIYSQIRLQPRYHCPGRIPGVTSYWRGGFRAWKRVTGSTFNEKGQIAIDFIKGLEQLKKPVLLLSGSCNELTGPTFQKQQLRLFQRAEWQLVSNSGHELLLDQPQAVLTAIRRFLHKHPN